MIKLLGTLPKKVYLGLSGGVDSMVAFDFLSKKHKVVPVFFNHGTETSGKACRFLADFFYDKGGFNHQVLWETISNPQKPKDKSWEEYWREERLKFFSEINKEVYRQECRDKEEGHDNFPAIITAHHLDDCVETYLFSALNGQAKLIRYHNDVCVRPFLLTSKDDILKYAERNKVSYVEDESNKDLSYKRNYIRHELMPHVLNINPGLSKVIKKKILEQFGKV